MTTPIPKLKASPPMVGGQTTALVPTAYQTTGSGAALQTQTTKTQRERIVRIEINSNDRDFSAYANPADFQWVSPYPLKNVTSMVIVGGTVPVPIYTIDVPFNSFVFDTGTEQKTITFPPGLYTPLLFAPAFKKLLDAADGTNTYYVNVDPITQILTTKSSGTNTFGFLFGTGSNFLNLYNPALQKRNNPATMLGFKDADVYCDATFTLRAPYAVNLNPIQRIYVYFNYDATMDLRSVVLGGGRAGPSAILYCTDADTVSYFTKSLNKDTYENVISPGLIVPRIRSIQVSLRDEFGNVLNTNNRPVSMLLEVTVLE